MKSLYFSFVFFISFLVLNLSAYAEGKGYFYDKEGTIKKGTTITITEYDPRLEGVFEVQTDFDYGANSYYTRIGDLMNASDKIKNGNFRKKPRSLQDQKFKLTADLVTYTYPIDID